MPEPRRGFLRAVGGAAFAAVAGTRSAAASWPDSQPAPQAGPARADGGSGKAGGSYAIAYTSFAVRLQRGRDLIRGAGAPALPAEAFIELCRSFGADGCQMDIAQLASRDAAYLDGLRRRIDEARLFLELSVGGKLFEDDAYFAEVAEVARKLGAVRLRVALLHGRRYEDFKTLAAWREFADHWRRVLPRAKGAIERHRLPLGIENHKDWQAEEQVELIRSVDSRYLGACVDFGNNVALLEDPLETARALAPYAITTHLKDMAVRPYANGFELSEVPLGTGICPLSEMIAVLRAARPEVPFCLEMITRDPLKVPYRDDVYWASYGGRDAERIARFEAKVLSRASAPPLPRVSSLGLDAMQAREDDNVRLSTAYARDTLRL